MKTIILGVLMSLGLGFGVAAEACPKLAHLELAGSFTQNGEKMQVWVGRQSSEKVAGGAMVAYVGGGDSCEAQCKVVRFERFRKDLLPALMELDCVGTRIRTMRMPLHIQWEAGNLDSTTIRLGSSIYGMETAPLKVELNRFAVASK